MSKKKEKRFRKNKENLREMQDNIKCNNRDTRRRKRRARDRKPV